jgi:Malectin domain
MLENSTNLAIEQAELEAVLSSGIFARAPSLAQLLSFICQKHFNGEHHLIKEYNIAVEALGRPADFDQKRDSIVRVEAHRLRKRLRQYYEGEGASHPLRIDLPSGGYTPVFLPTSQTVAAAPPEPAEASAPEQPALAEPSKPARIWTSRWVLAAAALLLVASILVLIGTRTFTKPTPIAPPQQVQPVDLATSANVSEVRIGAGTSSSFVDTEGHTWVADRYFKGGTAGSNPELEVTATLKPQLFRSWRQGDFTYSIPLKPGVYELTLHFVEPVFHPNSDSSRTFNVFINGVHALQEYEILNEAGNGQIVSARTWKDIRPGRDGFLTIEFKPQSNPAVVSAISVLAGTPGRLRPIRIATREEPYTDSAGLLWSPDRHFSGGKLVKRIEAIRGTEDPELYRGERYGRLSYTIPVPPSSTYTAILHFAETWFGGTGTGGANSRLFDILCNGLMLQQNFDVYKEAGGPFLALKKTYRGLKPTPTGKLVFQFVPSKNYAFLNAIEILDEAPAPKR